MTLDPERLTGDYYHRNFTGGSFFSFQVSVASSYDYVSFASSMEHPNSSTVSFLFDAKNGTQTGKRNNTLVFIEIGVQGVIFTLTLIGNLMVLALVLSLSRKRRKEQLGRMYTMIGHLSVADLSVATLNQLPQLAWDVTFRFQGGPLLCKMVTFGQVLAMYASSYVLLSTALDRYMAICHPMKSHSWSVATAHKLVGVAWVVAALFSTPQLVIFSLEPIQPHSQEYDCLANFDKPWLLSAYTTWFAMAVYVVPLILLGFIYIRICLVVWRNVESAAASVVGATVDQATILTATVTSTTGMTGSDTNSQRSRFEPKMSRSLVRQSSVNLSDDSRSEPNDVVPDTAMKSDQHHHHHHRHQQQRAPEPGFHPPEDSISDMPLALSRGRPLVLERSRLFKMNSLTSISEVSVVDVSEDKDSSILKHGANPLPILKRYSFSLGQGIVNSLCANENMQNLTVPGDCPDDDPSETEIKSRKRRRSFMSFMSVKRRWLMEVSDRSRTRRNQPKAFMEDSCRNEDVPSFGNERIASTSIPECRLPMSDTHLAYVPKEVPSLDRDENTIGVKLRASGLVTGSDGEADMPEILSKVDEGKGNILKNIEEVEHNSIENEANSRPEFEGIHRSVNESQNFQPWNVHRTNSEAKQVSCEYKKLQSDPEEHQKLDSLTPSKLNPSKKVANSGDQNQHHSGHGVSRAKARTAKLTMAVVIGYLLCWGPFFVSQLWWAWDPDAPYEDPFMVITLLLASLNSCINPWIYLAFSDQLRRRATRICCRHRRRRTIGGIKRVRQNRQECSTNQGESLSGRKARNRRFHCDVSISRADHLGFRTPEVSTFDLRR